jgi:Flp pilus assembly protein protease CpaA
MDLLEPAVFAYAALFVLIAMVADARSLRIPNWTVLALVAAYAARAWLLPGSVDPLADIALGGGVLVTGILLYEIGVRFPFAPGDWKLLAALALWFGGELALSHILLTTLAGGALAVAVAMARTRPFLQAGLYRVMPALARPDTPPNVIPYGIALGASALLLIAHQARLEGVV